LCTFSVHDHDSLSESTPWRRIVRYSIATNAQSSSPSRHQARTPPTNPLPGCETHRDAMIDGP
jgi:hypothetical protein